MITQTQTRPNLLPVVLELSADLETPVSAYLKLAGEGPSFLLESVSGGEHLARYSFIGINPSQSYVLKGERLEQRSPRGVTVTDLDGASPLEALREVMEHYTPLDVPGLPRFTGGLVGYCAYEMIHSFEPTVPVHPHPDLPEAIFLLADTLIAFDHAYGRLLLIANVPVNGAGAEEEARAEGQRRLDLIQARLDRPIPAQNNPNRHTRPGELKSNMTREQYMQAVSTAKEHIAAGDIFQVVPSQRLERQTSASAFSIYRALRRMNPSPYMFYFDFDGLAGYPDLHLIGASPEIHVRLEDGAATLRPIAGTRPRGQTEAEDARLEKELLDDPKERAEHVMLVDLARNDLGRVCDYGSVHVSEQMVIERYSHVMHIVSNTRGILKPEYDAFDLLAATFPAGTVSGAPKIRAMQIIHDLETDPRGPYAGAVGYFSFDGSMDTCIAIRTLVMRGETVSVQAGAGVVADSDPEKEYQETLNKARALAVAIEKAENP
ncbi:MAG: anthranilate synthase component I [Anaerolineales bacterium]|nr:anthranilate synthase component I [Anaerolineales bacterium]